MKNIIAVIAFFTITLLSTANAVAQDNNSRGASPEAKAFTHRLVQEFNIDKNQQKAVMSAFMYKQRQTKAINQDSPKTAKKAIDLKFDNKLKTILTEVQYAKYSQEKK